MASSEFGTSGSNEAYEPIRGRHSHHCPRHALLRNATDLELLSRGRQFTTGVALNIELSHESGPDHDELVTRPDSATRRFAEQSLTSIRSVNPNGKPAFPFRARRQSPAALDLQTVKTPIVSQLSAGLTTPFPYVLRCTRRSLARSSLAARQVLAPVVSLAFLRLT
ncbi:hypothetical protein MRB53_037596 [Persea americana]|nr:hypothetical protein MRB53_037596 [Persea americana]